MSNHDDLCPNKGWRLMPGITCGYCVLIYEAENRLKERIIGNVMLGDDGTGYWETDSLVEMLRSLDGD